MAEHTDPKKPDPKASQEHLQDKPLDETAKVHKAAHDQIMWFKQQNKVMREKALAEQKKAAELAKTSAKGKVGEANKPGATPPEHTPETVEGGGIGGTETGPASTQAGAAGAAIGAPAAPSAAG